MSDDRYSRQHGDDPYQSGSQPKKFTVHISDDDYENEMSYGAPRSQRGQRGGYMEPRRQQRSNAPAKPNSIARNEVPISRTRVITSRSGERYEIPEESALPPKLLRKTRKNQKSRGCLISVVYAIIVCSISALLAFYAIVGINDMFGLVKDDMDIVVSIPRDSTLNEVTKILDDNDVVDYPFFFKLYAGITNDSTFKHGDFTLNRKSDYDMIIRKLTRPSTADKSVVTVTIPEGKNLEQIAFILEDNCVCEQEAFFKTIAEREFKHGFYSKIPMDNEDRLYKLEGYLFPDTYAFYIWEGSVNAINRMLNAFDSKVYSNTELDFNNKAGKQKMSMDQIVTLASVIERETGDPEEMKRVASVFYNRMRNKSYEGIGGKLQSDATRWYPFPTQKDLKESDLSEEEKASFVSKYDTTTFAGLPPGPICCPGLNSIKAALEPADTDYYYFFTDKDANHYYAATYEQHQNNVANHR